jgi:SAM-dependent MidA family methyltransferase
VSPSTKVDALESGSPVKPEDDVGIVGRVIRTPNRPERAVRESSPAATAIISAVAERLAQNIGAALIIDYGYAGPAFGNTLQAVRKHRYDDPLAAPGEADLTAHVDFTALASAATKAGAEPRPLTTQGEFLGRLGLAARVATLSRGKDARTAAAIAIAAERLAGPMAMGELFKVLAVASAGLALPAFDEHLP